MAQLSLYNLRLQQAIIARLNPCIRNHTSSLRHPYVFLPVAANGSLSLFTFCQVESFESTEIAELLNDWFVAVKVDREERPDVDKVCLYSVVCELSANIKFRISN